YPSRNSRHSPPLCPRGSSSNGIGRIFRRFCGAAVSRWVKPATIQCSIFSLPERPLSSCRSHRGTKPGRGCAGNGSPREEAAKVATLWWRDDDAVAPTARLSRLLSIASGVPVSLAVIPADAEPELARWLSHYLLSAPKASVVVLQHGWRHLNRSGIGKKS